ncbi:MAG: hypothetical protein A2052_08445 [Deltaproteobacteria bacterium GWA2_54_12]|nr:MAG: hypothetical protein A2052_08445 [Deltaproteobacteria bacterium GWA2_54_12]
MDFSEIKDIAEGLKRRIEFLLDSGVTAVPKANARKSGAADACPADWAIFQGTLLEAASFVPCGHEGWKGVLFAVFPLGKAAILWGVPVTGHTLQDSPFAAEPVSQLERMLEWLAGQLKCSVPRVSNPGAVLAASCPETGAYSDAGAAAACRGALEPYLKGAGGILLMGELAVFAFLQMADIGEARGKVHKADGRSIVATYPPDDWVRDQSRKKAAHIDLKLLISACGS